MRVPQLEEDVTVMALNRIVRVRSSLVPPNCPYSYQVSADSSLVLLEDLRDVCFRDAEHGCAVCWGLQEWFPSGSVILTVPVESPSLALPAVFEGQIAFSSPLFSDGCRVKQFLEFYRVSDAQRAVKLMPQVLQGCHLCHHDQEMLFQSCHPPVPEVSDSNEVIIERIQAGLDTRTTCMIRNIPNKYTQAMLIEWLNEDLRGEYDFVYLRMDFKNHCNVGYAFINFVHPRSICKLARRCVGRRWPRFNSEKLGRLSYARIQGLSALLEKFRHSQVMQEPPNYRPKCFDHLGDEQPLF